MVNNKISLRQKIIYSVFTLLCVIFIILLCLEHSFLRRFFHAALTNPEEQQRIFAFFRTYGSILIACYVIFISSILFLENKNPDRTVAWLALMLAVPIGGVILYWIVGPNFRYLADKHRLRALPSSIRSTHSSEASLSVLAEHTAALVYNTSGEKIYSGCYVEILVDGEETFSKIKKELAKAKISIIVESYIVANDLLGNSIKEILIERAKAGVTICFIYDAVGSWKISSKFIRELKEAGVYVYSFLPVSFPMFRGANYRNHRKIIVIDEKIGFTGGLNIADEYLGKNSSMGYWRDTHLSIRGAAVRGLLHVVMQDMKRCRADKKLVKKFEGTSYPVPYEPIGTTDMQVIPSGPDTAWDTIQKMYFSLVARARKRVWVTTPYLMPGDALLEVLCVTALSGVDVRLLLPGKADHLIIYWATMHPCADLLRAGVRIFLYDKNRFVHAKTVVCDGVVFSAGTANFDTRSLHINFEVQALMFDKEIAQKGEEMFLTDLSRSTELTLEEWEKRPFYRKVQENFGKLFSSLG